MKVVAYTQMDKHTQTHKHTHGHDLGAHRSLHQYELFDAPRCRLAYRPRPGLFSVKLSLST